MKRSIAVLAFVLAFSAAAWAQPTFTFSSANPCSKDTFSVNVTVKDFTDIHGLKFPIHWDKTVMKLVSVDSFNLENLDASDFTTSRSAEGLLFLKWEYSANCTAAESSDKKDGTRLFSIRFVSTGSYGATSEIGITEDPILIANGDLEPVAVFRPSSLVLNPCPNIGYKQSKGLISTCLRPLHLYADTKTANTGDLVCSDISVTGFDGLTALQFSIEYDSTILDYSYLQIPNTLPSLGKDNFATPETSGFQKGKVTMSWAWAVADPDRPSITIPDSTVIFQLCYTVIGECEKSTAVSFTSEPTKIEAINVVQDSEYVIPVVVHPGAIKGGDCTPTGLQLFADCGDPVMLNDEVCVGVSAVGLQSVTEMSFLMNFNPKILEFKAINLTTAGKSGIPNLVQSNFNPISASKGYVGFTWQGIGSFTATVPDNTPIFEVCFTVVGLGGNAPFSFDPNTAHVFKKPNSTIDIGIYPHNCAVEVIQPSGIQIEISDKYGKPGDTLCFDYTVNNFNQIVGLDFSSNWPSEYIKFLEIKNLALPGLTLSNFDTSLASSGAVFSLMWDRSSAPVTLVDGSSLFQVCFEVVGVAPKELGQLGLTQNCSNETIGIFSLTGDPTAINASSAGQNIGIQSSGGDICIINPTGYELIVDDAETFKGDTVPLCVDFRVVDFNNIVTSDFIVNWDPTVFEYHSVVISPDLESQGKMNIDLRGASVGSLGFSWETNATDEEGTSLADLSSLMKVCFVPVGEPGTCIDLEIDIENFPSVLKIDGEGSVFPKGGTICIKDRLVITSVEITPVTCSTTADGTVSLTVEGGKGNIFYYWEAPNTQRQFLSKARNLPVGEVIVTIFDESVPQLFLRDTFEVPLTDNLPFADAGDDLVLNCKPPAVQIKGDGSKPALDFQYKWSTIGGSLPGTTDSLTAIAASPGTYILSVINKATQCAAKDTVLVFPANMPVANAGDDVVLSCTSDTLRLNAGLSSPIDSITFRWIGLDGGIVMAGDSAKQNPIVLTAGKYALEVLNKFNACISFDTVIVTNPTEIPSANAGVDQELGCAGATATLDASASVNLRGVTYTWLNAMGQEVGNSKIATVSEIGTYFLVVKEEGSGCIARDTVLVTPSQLYPVVSLGNDTLLSCINPIPVIQGKVSNSNKFFYEWQSPNGGVLSAGSDTTLTPTVLVAGDFVLVVTDSASNCITKDTITIIPDTRRPTAEAGSAGILSCRDPKYTLKGLASSPNGEFNTMWEIGGQVVASDSLNISVAAPGTYRFTVTDKRSGCTAVDSVNVTSIIDTPTVVVNTVNATITCGVRSLNLQTAVNPTRTDYTIAWSTADGVIAGGASTLSPTITAAGLYKVTATNPTNGCTGFANVPVFADTVKPVANAGADLVLSCAVQNVTLNGAASSSGGKYAYKWTGQSGVPSPENATSMQAIATNGGEYVLEVTDTFNLCVSTDKVLVTMDTVRPVVVIEAPATLSCTILDVALDGSNSEKGGSLTASWTSLSGQPVGSTNNAYVARATVKGSYQLSVKNNSNGCTGIATVEIPEDRQYPEAVVQPSVQLPCQGAVRNLDGIGTSSGATFTYLWRTISGKGTITDETTLSPKVNTPGLYGLQVTNTVNGCTDTANVLVVVDPALVFAQAGTDLVSCTEDAQLTGNQPTGTTGVWSSKSGATVDAPSEFISEVYGLKAGQNVFVWTLSKAECPNYSADSVVVFRDVAPSANNDELIIEPLARSGTINVAQNDQLTLANGFNVEVITSPKLGRIDSVTSATVNFGVPPRIYGQDEFSYVICSNACPDHCDTALVKVEIKYDPNLPQEPVANAITPNGDGSNDALRFELLENGDPAIFPDNEIIIFNRWGDIVYQARPYNNDWKGVNAAGKELPHATYYYILRLDISKGLIIQGDVTILK